MKHLMTERRNKRTMHLDDMPILEALKQLTAKITK